VTVKWSMPPALHGDSADGAAADAATARSAAASFGYGRLAGNTAATVAGRAVAIVLALVLSTVLFRVLGQEQFGLWSLFAYLVGYSTLIDFGLSPAVERRVARLNAERRRAEIRATLRHALLLAVVAMAALQIGSEVAARVYASYSGKPVSASVRDVLHVLPGALFLVVGSLVVGSALSGLQRMASMHAWRTAGMVVGTAATCVLVLAGVRRLDALLLAYVAGAPVAAVGQWWTLSRALPAAAARASADAGTWRWQSSVARELLGFGGVLQVATFGPLVGDYVVRLVLARRFGVEYAGLYDLASRAAFGLRSIVSSLFVSMVPFGVGVLATADRVELARLVRLAVKYTALFMLPCSVLLWIFADPAVRWWLGPGSGTEQVAAAVRPLVLLHALASLTVPMAMIGRSAGKPFPEVVTTWAGVAVGVGAGLLAPSFIWAVGLFGVAPLAAGVALWIWLSLRFGVRFEGGRDLLGIVAVSVVTALATHGMERLAVHFGGQGAWVTVAAVAAGVGAAAAATMLLRLVGPRERALLLSLVGRGH
jgi:O-antigen/teichoic acid export membrane protein